MGNNAGMPRVLAYYIKEIQNMKYACKRICGIAANYKLK